MLTTSSSQKSSAKTPGYGTGGLLLFVAAAVILTALGFEHLDGQKPCALCLQERYAYYAAIPMAFVGLVLLAADMRRAAALLFFAIALIFLANVGLAAYHVGIEMKYWPGPVACSAGGLGSLNSDAGSLLASIAKARVVACDEVNWRFLGLSFAGWNAVMSLFLFATAIKASFTSVSRND